MKAALCTAGDFRSPGHLWYSISEGLQKAFPGISIEQYAPHLISPQSTPRCDILITNGQKRQIKEVLENHSNSGKLSIVFDLGYINRLSYDDRAKTSGKNFQLSMHKLGWIPEMDCPADRFESLKIEVLEMDYNRKGCILVCGQKFQDAQHNMDELQMRNFCASELEACKKMYPNKEIKFRPHPLSFFEVEGFETDTNPLKDCLKGVSELVTYNSTIGLDAITIGIPVRCSSVAHYYHISKSQEPTREDILNHFSKLAYTQWTPEEMAKGVPFKFLMDIHEGRDPFKGMVPEAETPEKVEPTPKVELVPKQNPEELQSEIVKELKEALSTGVTELPPVVQETSFRTLQKAVKDKTGVWPRSYKQAEALTEKYLKDNNLNTSIPV